MNSGGGEHLGELDQLHAEAQVGLVDAVAVHGLVPGDLRDLAGSLAEHRLGGVEHRLRDEGEHLVLRDEARLGVELHELVLPVGAQVLVPQAAGDLVVAIGAADHQQLLEELRRLRQRVEAARHLPGRHEELAGALGGGRHEHRRLDLDEPLPLHRPPDGGVDGGPDAQVALHPLAAEVEVAVPQPDHLVDVVGALVDRERRRGRDREDLDRAVPHLDAPVARASLVVPSGRARTVPVMRTTNSLRRSAAPSTTHWTIPVWSRRSMKARCSPCSRRRPTQPQTDDDLPLVLGAQRPAHVGAHRFAHGSNTFLMWSTTTSRATVVCSPVSRSRTVTMLGRPPRPRRR